MPSTTRRGLIATLGIAAFEGCLNVSLGDRGDLGPIEGEWPLVGQDPGHRRRAISAPHEPQHVWRHAIPQARGTSPPVLADGRLYASVDAVTDRARHRYGLHSLEPQPANRSGKFRSAPNRTDPPR